MAWALMGLVIAVLLAVPWFGADSRDGRDWHGRHRHGRPGPALSEGFRPASESPGGTAVRAVIRRLGTGGRGGYGRRAGL